MKKILMLVVAAGMITAGCEGTGNKQAWGTVLGAGIGAALGAHAKGDAEPAVIMMGALAGGLIGNQIGKQLDEADRVKMAQARYDALEYNRSYDTQGWYNPDTGNRGDITPYPAYQNDQGQYCREFQQTIIVGGDEVDGYGTACRQPDGSWKIVSTRS